jgi:hypothetical protein
VKMLSIHAKWSNGSADGDVSFSLEELNRGLKIEIGLFRNTWERICVTLHEVCDFNV